MFIGNLIGFGMFISAALIVAIGIFILKFPNTAVMISAGITLIFIDLIFRSFSRKYQGWLWENGFGGNLFFLPVWSFGIAVIIINLINVFVVK